MRYSDIQAELRGGKSRQHSEDDFQIGLIQHIKVRKVPGLVYYMIRNHGQRSAASRRKDAAMGLIAGASDLGLVIPPHGTAGLLELKWPPNVPTKEQEHFGLAVLEAGGFHAVAYNLDQAIEILTAWQALRA
jgi:hypothetical protein